MAKPPCLPGFIEQGHNLSALLSSTQGGLITYANTKTPKLNLHSWDNLHESVGASLRMYAACDFIDYSIIKKLSTRAT